MKTQVRCSNKGSVLLAVLALTAIFTLFAAYYFQTVSQQHRFIVRSQLWNSSIPVADAGVEEALSHLDKNCRDKDVEQGYLPKGATNDGWQIGADPSKLTIEKTRAFGDGFYRVVIDFATVDKPVIYAEGFTANRLTSRRAAAMFASISTKQYGSVKEFNGKKISSFVPRGVWVLTRNAPMFEGAIAADGMIDLNGNNILTDSFDSRDPNRSNNGKYKSGVGAAGHVATNGKLIDVGNANIKGKVRTGEGGEVEIKNNGTVGDLDWKGPGIQEGYFTEDMNQQFDPVELPSGPFSSPVSVNGTNIFYAGTYKVDTLTGKVLIAGPGTTTIVVTKSIDFSGQQGITIAPGASLVIYMDGPTTKISGNGIVNTSGNALDFQYYGTSNNKTIDITGNGTFAGTIYAPKADITLRGGGSNPEDFVGAVIGKTATLLGHFKFHYDEAIGKFGPKTGYKVVQWREVAVNQ